MREVTISGWILRDPQPGPPPVHAAILYLDPESGQPQLVEAFGTMDQHDANSLIVRPTIAPQSVPAATDAFVALHAAASAPTRAMVLRSPVVMTVPIDGLAVNPRTLVNALANNAATSDASVAEVAATALAGAATQPVPGLAPVAAGIPASERTFLAVPDADRDGTALPCGGRYLPRSLGGQPDYLVLRKLRGVMNVRLKGLAGGGKTSLPVAAFGTDLITVQGHGELTVSSLVGQYQPTADGGFVWADGPLTKAMREGRPFMVDEITRAPSETIAALQSVADHRTELRLDDRPDLPVVQAAEGFTMLITYNEEGQGVRPLDDAVKRRFPFQVEVETDYDIADQLGINDLLLKVARNMLTKHLESIAAGGYPVWRPQMADLLASQAVLDTGLGMDVAASTLIAACTTPEDVPDLQAVIASVMGLHQLTTLALGGAL